MKLSIKNTLRSDWILYLILGLVSLLGVGIALSKTAQGARVNDDSVLFVAGAQSIARGYGFSWLNGDWTPKPITGFPPGYSFLLSIVEVIGISPYSAAAVFNAVIFGALIFVVGCLVFSVTGSSVLALIGSVLILTSRSLLNIYTWVMADGIFYFVFVLAIYVASFYLRSFRRPHLIALAVLIAVASMLRYIGISLYPAVTIAIFLRKNRTWKLKIQDVILLSVLSLSPLVIFSLRNIALAGTAYNRDLAIPQVQYNNLVDFLNEVFSWFFPDGLGLTIRLRWQLVYLIALYGLLPVIFYLCVRKGKITFNGWVSDAVVSFLVLNLLVIVFYAAVILMTVSHYSLDEVTVERYLHPLMIVSVSLELIIIFGLIISTRHFRIWGALGALVAIVLVTFSTVDFKRFIDQEINLSNADFLRQYPQNVEVLTSLDESIEIVTNEIYLVYYISNRPSHQIPLLRYGYEGIIRNDVQSQMASYRNLMRNGAVLVLFDWIKWQETIYPSKEELISGLVMVRKIGFGAIYIDPAYQDTQLFGFE